MLTPSKRPAMSHDSSYKLLFSHAEMAADLQKGTRQIPKAKAVHYLLSSTHRAGRGKARFFSAFGFKVSAWAELTNALRQQTRESDVVLSEDTPFGTRYMIEGSLVAPNDHQLQVRTVWFIDAGGQAPRFVTAYPLIRRVP